MALVVKDRVRESSATTGTGTITLSGAYVGFVSFATAVTDGSTVFYCIHNTAPGVEGEWEVGYGTYSSGTLTRDTLYSSSTGSAVSFSAGTKEVFITYPAEAAVFEDNSGNVTVEGKITVGAAPTADLDVATKAYVDNAVAAALHYHDPVRVESPTALTVTYNNGTAGVGATLTNAGTQVALALDGITLNVADRVLIYTQTDATQNGVYTVTDVGSGSTNWVLTRATDADSYAPSDPDAFGQGDAFYVQEGATGAGESYVLTTQGTITFGTTDITFSQFAATPAYTGGTNINVTAQTISITGTIDETNGGTGNNSYTTGDILYSNSANSLAKLAGNTTTTAKYLTQTGDGANSAAPTWTALAASATTDTTNASNISSGTLASARISGSYTGITGVGTLTAGTWTASTVGVAYGGTGLTSYAIGDIVYASGSTTLSKLAGVATGNVLLSGGVTTAPSYGKVGLTTHVSGTLPIANGGTNSTTATGAFDNLAPAQTGNSGKFLTTDGSTTSWGTPTAANNGTLTMAVSGTGLSGSASFTADQSGNSTFTVTSNATNANTASTIVARDASGNFSAGTITAALSGNATTATTASATTATLTRGSYLTGSNFNGSSATTWAVDAATANTASKIVARDASGNFSAGTITAALSGNATTATTLQTARTIGGVSFNGSANIDLPGVNTTGNQNTSGNAGTATTLATARTINGVSFNGSANITVEPYVEDAGTTSATRYVTFVDNSTAGYKRLNEDADFTYNPGTNTLTAVNFSGALSGNATTATTLQTARNIGGVSFNGSADINLPGVNTAGNQNTTGNAATATTLATARTINGVSFNGSANITVESYIEDDNSTNATRYLTFVDNSTAAFKRLNEDSNLTYNPSTNTLTTGTFSGALSGNATTATTLQTARTIGGVSFNGSANIDLPGVNTAGNQNTSGNAATATTLATARTINGVSFDGSANITVADSTKLPLTGGTISSNLTVSGTLSVRTALDLADSDVLRLGSSDDWEFFHNGTDNYMDLNVGNLYIRDTTTTRFTFARTTGDFTATGNVTAYSDERLKKDWLPVAEDFVERLSKVKSGTYTRIDTGEKQAGSSAQDWQSLLPEVVSESDDEQKTLSLAYGNAALVSVVELAKRIMEQDECIKELRAEIKALKGE